MERVDPSRTGLLVIDMQNGWCHPDGAMTRAGQDMTAQRAIVANVSTLVQACRSLGMPILWSIQEHLPEDVTQNRRRIASHLRKRNILPAPRGTWDAELVAPLKEVSKPNDYYIVKHRMSFFYATTLEAVLRMRGVTHLVVSGVSTNVCVESTVRDAYFRDYDVTVIEDCVAGSFPELHRATLENTRIFFGEVVSLKDFLSSHGIESTSQRAQSI